MTQETRIRALFLSKAPRHLSTGDVIDLMGAGSEEKGFHNARHVTGDTAAAFRFRRVVRVLRREGEVLKLGMASRAHQIRLVGEL
jgi:hypothetical protein